MIEFRTTVKPDQKEEVVGQLEAALSEVADMPEIRTESHARIVLITICFDTMERATQFTEILREREVPTNRWILHEPPPVRKKSRVH